MPKKTKKYEPKNIVLTLKDNVVLRQVGGNFNTRLKINYKDVEHEYYESENEGLMGEKIKRKETKETLVQGFFTENIEINSNKNFATFIEKMRTNNTNKYNKYFAAFFDNFARTHNPKNYTSQLLNTLIETTGIDLEIVSKEDKKEYINITNQKYRPGIDQKVAINNLVNLIANNLDESLREEFLQEVREDNSEFFIADVFNDSATFLNKNIRNEKTAVILHEQNIEGNVNERNNAMYDYGVLLNKAHIFAKSFPMTIIKDGKAIHGSYMLNVEGVLCEDLLPSNPALGGYDLKMSGEGMKGVSDMEIMDFLCANTDRTSYNLAYQLKKDDLTQSVYIVGVQGIDNDASFGTIKYKTGKDFGSYISKLDQLKWIDKAMAESVLNMDEEKLTEKLMVNKLTYEEINAAKERLHALQQKITSKKIKILEGDQWEETVKELPNIAKTNPIYNNVMVELSIYKRPYHEQYQANGIDPNSIAKVSTTNEAFNLAITSNNIKEFAEQIKDLQIDSPEKTQLQIELNILSKTLSKLAESKGQKIEVEPINNINNINNVNNPQPDVPDYTISMLSDFQRNMLSDSFKHVIDAATDLEKTITNPKLKFTIKSIIAKTNELALGMKEDAMEAEKNLLEKMALAVSKGEDVAGKVQNISNSKDIRKYAAFSKQTAIITNKIAKYAAKEPQDSPLNTFMKKTIEYRSTLETALVTGDFSETSQKFRDMLNNGLMVQEALKRKPIYKLTEKERDLKISIEAMSELYKQSPKTPEGEIKMNEFKAETFSKDKKDQFLSNLFTLAQSLEDKKDTFMGMELKDSKEMKDIKKNLLNVLNLSKKKEPSMLETRLAVRHLEEAAKAYIANPEKAENARKAAVRDIAEYIDENIGYFGIDKSRSVKKIDKEPIGKVDQEPMIMH